VTAQISPVPSFSKRGNSSQAERKSEGKRITHGADDE
jgi:hypothetical protein